MVIKWFVTKFNVLKVRPNQPIEPITSQFISLFGPDCTLVRLNQGRTNSIMVDSTTFYLFIFVIRFKCGSIESIEPTEP
jgi:hypothetical protein